MSTYTVCVKLLHVHVYACVECGGSMENFCATNPCPKSNSSIPMQSCSRTSCMKLSLGDCHIQSISVLLERQVPLCTHHTCTCTCTYLCCVWSAPAFQHAQSYGNETNSSSRCNAFCLNLVNIYIHACTYMHIMCCGNLIQCTWCIISTHYQSYCWELQTAQCCEQRFQPTVTTLGTTISN